MCMLRWMGEESLRIQNGVNSLKGLCMYLKIQCMFPVEGVPEQSDNWKGSQ